MRRWRPSLLVLLLICVFGLTFESQASIIEPDSLLTLNTSSLRDKANVKITNNTALNRFMITSDQPMNGSIDLAIFNLKGELVYNTSINSTNSKLVTYPSAMLKAMVYMVSCAINGEVWTEMVTIE